MYKSLKAFRQVGTKVERYKRLMWRVKSTTIAATLLLAAVFCQSCKIRVMKEETIMKVYSIGYFDGYKYAKNQAKKFKNVNDSIIEISYSNYDTCLTRDSLIFYNAVLK